MNQSRPLSMRRIGFTLIELLVVIAIIAVLMGLIIPASMKLLSKPPQFNTSAEIGQMQTSIQAFQTEFKVNYIPSRIKLCRKLSEYGPTQLDTDSKEYLLSLFPRMANKWNTVGINWGGTTNPVTLEGHQCLVFFLGGVPLSNPPGCGGWSGDQQDPANLSVTQGRKEPYFDFKAERLFDRNGNGFYSYKDPYYQNDAAKDQPYAYFSSYGNNGYMKYLTSDCTSLGVSPYVERQSPLHFHNPKTFQIISAGANRTFGQGGLWTPNNPGMVTPANSDDQSNFYPTLLGVVN